AICKRLPKSKPLLFRAQWWGLLHRRPHANHIILIEDQVLQADFSTGPSTETAITVHHVDALNNRAMDNVDACASPEAQFQNLRIGNHLGDGRAGQGMRL